jgi:hypothetical protein
VVAPLVELGARVVVLSASLERALRAQCLDDGAVDKAMPFDELVAYIRRGG